ncbi:MAG: beta-lactamase family protein [Bacteroidales bacterium]|nr:beta-lactamase family protein [Bacteroidales bacterium]
MIIWIFFGEIASSFPFKKSHELPVAESKIVPFSHRLSNDFSSYPSTAVIDSVFTDFMRKRDIKGASVSITRNGHLLYSKGFGYADEELGIQTEPYHLFRIASVSKLITAVAIMKMKESGILDLNDKVFGPDGILNDSIYLDYQDKRFENITVQQLLNHTAGWRHKGRDPVFRALEIKMKGKIMDRNINMDDIILFVLKQKLDYVPGTIYSYSNFGYALLGKIIEIKSGMRYEEYLNYEIFQPLGIYDMHLGKSFMEEQLLNEVRYYDMENTGSFPAYNATGTMVPLTYGANSLELLGSAGGWLASSPELIRLVCAIDGFSGFPDILASSSITEMTTPIKRSTHLYGWRGSDGYGTWWRTGTLSGSIALVMRYNNEFNWVVLLNTSPVKRKKIHSEISQIIYKAMLGVDDWPRTNLFMN